jgi:tetratricopeptide (TPR) repeat protein/RNA polymerase subunit RPABC4/transcription elongation factor Spt4
LAGMINCPYCGKLTDPKLDGCPHCGAYLKKKPAAAKAARSTKSHTCPNCTALVQEGDIICVACGTNLLTGQKITDEAQPVGTSQGSDTLPWLVGGGVLVAVCLTLAGLFYYMATSDPVAKAQKLYDNLDYAEAQEVLSSYVERDPDNEAAFELLGKVQWEASQFDNAAASFARAVDINPGNIEAALWAVVSLHAAGRTSTLNQQIELLEQASQVQADDAVIWYLLAMAKGVRGQPGDYEAQVDALRRVANLQDPEDALHRGIAVGYALQRDYRNAQYELEQMENTSASDLALRGVIASMQGNTGTAVPSLREAVDTGSGFGIRWQALTKLGQLLILDGRFRDAEAYLSEALAIQPSNAAVRYLHALSLHAQGLVSEALNEYDTLIDQQGAFAAEAGIQAASLYLGMGDVENADRTISAAGRNGAQSAAYHTIRGRVYTAMNNMQNARQSFEQAAKVDPDYAPLYLERGLFFVKAEALGQGLVDLEQYLRLVGDDVQGTRAADIRELVRQLHQTQATTGRE